MSTNVAQNVAQEKEVKSRDRKKLNLATAKIADGALDSPKSVYEIMGYSPTRYKANTLEEFRRELRGLPLWKLQEKAQELGVVPGYTIDVTIKRLEAKFNQDQRRFALPQSVARNESDASRALKEQAEDIMARRA